MTKTLSALFFFSLASVALANDLGFEIHWFASDDSNASAIQDNSHTIFVHVNGHPVTFNTVSGSIRNKSNGSGIAQSISYGKPSSSVFRVGNNEISYSFFLLGTNFLTSGFFESEFYSFLNGRRNRICQTSMAAKQRAYGSCRSHFQMTLDELSPTLAAQIRNLESEISGLRRQYRVDDFETTINQIENIIAKIRNKNFDEYSDSDFQNFSRAFSLYQSLRKSIDVLRQEIAETKEKIRENLSKTRELMVSELNHAGVFDIREPVVNATFACEDIKIPEPIFKNQDSFDQDNNIHKIYADKVLQVLESQAVVNDRTGFLAEIAGWTRGIAILEQMALSRQYYSKREWEAFQLHYKRVDDYVYVNVDRDLWFRNSPVPHDVRTVLKEDMKELAPQESHDLESVLKRLSEKDITPQLLHGIELVRNLALVGREIVKSSRQVVEVVKEFQQTVADTTRLIGNGFNCLVRSQVSGRAGSFYELTAGKDICTGHDLSEFDRMLAGVELALGSPKFLMAVATVVGIGSIAKKTTKIIDLAKVGQELIARGLLKKFSTVELSIVGEADTILKSTEFVKIRAAHSANKSVTVKVGGRTVQYEPIPVSGMTMFGDDGFVIGKEAFSSSTETHKTLFHELHRLFTSKSASGVSGELAARETKAAQEFADRAFEALTK